MISINRILVAATFVVAIGACSKVPITNRKQVNMLPESQLIGMSLTEYNTFLSQNPPVASSDPNEQMVQRVGLKISKAVEDFMRQNKMADRVQGYNWQFNLVNNEQANAWCMPGGKVVVYSGILPYTQTEEGLAFVMGHEIAHAVARHGNERMSQGLIAQAGGMALDVALSQKSEQTRQLFGAAYGAGATYGVILPFSRTHESEADKLGLVFMAMAGYNPQNAPQFWERMSKSGGAKPPELLSTHPSDAKRIKELNAYMPQAMKYYKPQ